MRDTRAPTSTDTSTDTRTDTPTSALKGALWGTYYTLRALDPWTVAGAVFAVCVGGSAFYALRALATMVT